MEKLGVELDKEVTEKAEKTKSCPKCAGPIVTPPCNNCGTKPFEKKPDNQG